MQYDCGVVELWDGFYLLSIENVAIIVFHFLYNFLKIYNIN